MSTRLSRASQVAACTEVPGPWRRHGRRGISITIIVIEILRIVRGEMLWENPLESALVAAIGLLTVGTVAELAGALARLLHRMVPERVVLERRNGKRRLAFGW